MQNQNSQFERLTGADVEAEYKIPQGTLKVQRWARQHQKPGLNWGPPYEKAGRKVLYRRTDIEAWLAAGRVG